MEKLIFRISPWTHSDLKVLKFSTAAVDAIYDLSLVEKKVVDELLAAIFSEIGKCEDYARKMTLIQLRRNIFNNRKEEVDPISYGPSIDNKLDELRIIRSKSQALRNDLKLQLERDLPAIEAGFDSFLHRPELLNGLAMSGSDLLQTINKLNSLDHKKRGKAINALLRYISRIALKPTPFSQFTMLGQAAWTDEGRPFLQIRSKKNARSLYSINTQVAGFISEMLVAREDAREFLSLQLNSARFIEGKRLGFLHLHKQSEKLNFLNINDFIDVIVSYLQDKRMSYISLIDELASEYDLERPDLDSMIGSLANAGLILVSCPLVLTSQDSIAHMKDFLQSVSRQPGDVYSSLARRLSELGSVRDALARTTALEKAGLVTSAEEIFKSIVEDLTSDPEEIKHYTRLTTTSSIIFEDYCDGNTIELDRNSVSGLLADLERVCSLMLLLDDTPLYLQAVTHHFVKDLGATRKVGFMELYHWYNQEDNKSKIDATYTEKWRSWNQENSKKVSDLLRQLISVDSNEICLDLNKAEGSMLTAGNPLTSLVSYLQFFNSGDQVNAVLTGLYYGYGKMFSRFLHLFDNDLIDCIRDENRSLQAEGTILVENTDVSWSPLNFHPEMLDYEISVPNGYSNYLPEKQIALKDITAGISEETGVVTLTHNATGKEICILDLGMQNYLMRTKIHDFLERFTKFRKPLTVGFISMIDEIAGVPGLLENSIGFYPRIVIGQRLVLRRASWKIDKKLVPQKRSGMTTGDYMIDAGLFIRQHRLPMQFFVRLSVKGESGSRDIDHRKPQYIDLASPLFCDLFASIVEKVEKFIYLEEFLPNSDNTVALDGQARAVEFQHQFSVPMGTFAQ